MTDLYFPIEALEQFLNQLDFTKVDFNVSLGDNGQTPLLTLVQFACYCNNVSPLKIVLEKANFHTLDFSRNVLPLLFNFSAYYTPVRAMLLMVLEKIDSKQLGEVLKQINALIFIPILILGLEGRSKIFKILLSKDKENALGLNEALKDILLKTKEEAIEAVLADAFATGKLVVKAEDFLLACCWNGARRAAVAFIRKTNQVLDYV